MSSFNKNFISRILRLTSPEQLSVVTNPILRSLTSLLLVVLISAAVGFTIQNVSANSLASLDQFAANRADLGRTTYGIQSLFGPVDLGDLTDYLFFFGDGRSDANWQGASKGFVGDVAVNGLVADERTSGSVPYGGTIYTNDATLGAWADIVDQNDPAQVTPAQAFGVTGQTTLIDGLKADINSAFSQINALPATAGYTNVASTSLNGLNTTNGVAETFVINITSGLSVSSLINITGDPGDIFILRWDEDANFSDGYEGQVKFQSGGAIIPLGGLSPANFIHVAGDINASGGGSTPLTNYFPQAPRFNNGYGNLVVGAADFSGGGFFTGYWLTTGAPTNPADATWVVPYGDSSSLSNAIFVGGWYSINTSFSMTSGTSGVYYGPMDYGDLPEPKYKTTRATSGASHVTSAQLFMGSSAATDLDTEGDGQPNATASGDDVVGQDDESAVTFPNLIRGQSADVTVSVTNNTGSAATLYGFIDWDNDGSFTGTGEAVTANVPNGTAGNVTLTFNVPAGAVTDTELGARFRLSTVGNLTANNPAGTNGSIPAPDGEVEDYLVTVSLLDWGDLPDTGAGTGAGNYQTNESDNGPRHVVGSLRMGAAIDGEDDGQPNATATGDDSAGATPDDEDGVTIPALTPGATVTITVNASSAGKVNGFIDWNNDGDFDDSGETLAELTVAAGNNDLVVNVPLSAVTGTPIGARFRLSSQGGLGSIDPGVLNTGLLSTDEVGKYLVISMGDDADVGRAFQMSNTEIGADREVLSTPSDPGYPTDGGFPNLLNVFGGDTPPRWNLTTDPDSLNGAATVFEGIDWSGEVALTSDNGKFDSSNSLVFADTGIQTVVGSPLASVSNSLHFDVGQTAPPSAGTTLAVGNGVATGKDFTTLLADLSAWKTFILGLSAEVTINSNTPFQNNEASNGDFGLRTNYDGNDTNGDGIVVIDLNSNGSLGDFNLVNLDWVIDGSGSKLVIFRLRNGSNMIMNEVSIVLGDGGIADQGIGVIFFSGYEGSGSGDTVFNVGSSVVLNGIGLWDLNAVGEGGNTKTNININNGQGCAQFISQKVNFQNNRWNRCTLATNSPDGEVEDYLVTVQQVAAAQIGDRVWEDTNGDGIQDGGELGIPNVTVELYQGATLVASTTTDANGIYTFTVAPDTYSVKFIAPQGYDFTQQDQGGDNDADSDADPVSGETTTFVVGSGQVDKSWDAGLYQPAQIGDRVWADINGDGIQDVGELGVEDATVELYTSNNTLVASTTTDANGIYTFTVAPGTYYVKFTAPAGLGFTQQDQGLDDTTDSDPDPTTGDTTTFTVSSGETDVTWDAGILVTADYTITKTLNTPDPVRTGEDISFTIRITNTGSITITTLPLTDTYDITYLIYTEATPSSDDNSNDGVVNWSDLTAAGPNGFGQGLEPGASFAVVVEFVGRADTTALPNGVTVNTAAVTGAVADPDGPGGVPSQSLPTKEAIDDVAIFAPTAVTLANYGVAADRAAVRVEWQTVDESNIAYFDLYRVENETSILLATLFAERTGQPSGKVYTYADIGTSTAIWYNYRLDIVQLDGSLISMELGSIYTGINIFLPNLSR